MPLHRRRAEPDVRAVRDVAVMQASGVLLHRLPAPSVPRSQLPVNSVCFGSAARYLCSGGAQQLVHVWDLKQRQIVQSFKGHTSTVRRPHARLLARAVSAAYVSRVPARCALHVVCRTSDRHVRTGMQACLMVRTGPPDRTHDARLIGRSHIFCPLSVDRQINCLAMAHNDVHVTSASASGDVLVHSLRTSQQVTAMRASGASAIRDMCYSPIRTPARQPSHSARTDGSMYRTQHSTCYA